MDSIKCNENCNVMFLSELYVCDETDCYAPQIRCKSCFRLVHSSTDETGKKKTHRHSPFDESNLYKNFLSLVKVYEAIGRRMRKIFGALVQNLEGIIFAAFKETVEVKKAFNNDYLLNQFWAFRELYFKRQVKFMSSPTSQFISAMNSFSEKEYNNTVAEILRPSGQDGIIEHNFTELAGNHATALSQFIVEEQEAFKNYCESLNGEGFDIKKYLASRRKQENRNATYYTRDFQNFMEDKYEIKPEEQDLFELPEYTRHAWAHFHTHLIDQNIQHYFDHWVQAYKVYSEYIQQFPDEEERLLPFRMWQQQYAKYDGHPMKNIYFLDAYILGYIESLMRHKSFGVGPLNMKDWKEYGQFLKDYVDVVQLKEMDYVDLSEYQSYFDFRKEQVNKFLQHIKNSSEIIYNKAKAIEYANRVFKDGGKIALKAYKKYLAQQEEEDKKKMEQVSKIVEKLKQQVQGEQGDKFYLNVFNGFVEEAIQTKSTLNKQNYYFYKQKILELVDEDTIIREHESLEMAAKELEKEEQQQETVHKEKEGKIQYHIDAAEKYVQIANQEQSDDESDEGQDVPLCSCCKGKPYECEQPECQNMGFCTTCSF